MSEKNDIKYINQSGDWDRAISWIIKPTERVKIAAVKKNYYAIGYIKHPSDDVIYEAIVNLLSDIDEDGEKVDLEIIKGLAEDYFKREVKTIPTAVQERLIKVKNAIECIPIGMWNIEILKKHACLFSEGSIEKIERIIHLKEVLMSCSEKIEDELDEMLEKIWKECK